MSVDISDTPFGKMVRSLIEPAGDPRVVEPRTPVEGAVLPCTFCVLTAHEPPGQAARGWELLHGVTAAEGRLICGLCAAHIQTLTDQYGSEDHAVDRHVAAWLMVLDDGEFGDDEGEAERSARVEAMAAKLQGSVRPGEADGTTGDRSHLNEDPTPPLIPHG